MKYILTIFALQWSVQAFADDFENFSEFDNESEQVEIKDIDPWVNFNKRIFEFNETLDRYVLKPIAFKYATVVPDSVDIGVTNFFRNFQEPMVVANDIFQLKIRQAASDSARFVVNTLLGFFGIFDVASHFGLNRHEEDFGQTLGYWGVSSGPYVVLPFLGPSTLRDSIGSGVEFSSIYYAPYLDPLFSAVYPKSHVAYYATSALRTIDVRASLLAAEGLITGDKYIFIRSAYLQRREYLVNDGLDSDPFASEEFSDSPSQAEDNSGSKDVFDQFPEFE